jgi:hypothetical protein
MRGLLLALCACNRVLGVTDVDRTDARLFDALPDAQPYCPTTTGVVPRFSTTLHQVIDQYCLEYETSASFAIAMCQSPLGTVVSQGPLDMPLQPITGLPALVPNHLWQNPRISPEGDVLYLDDFDLTAFTAVYHSFTRRSDGTWAPGPNLPIPTYGIATVPSRGPGRHLLFYDTQLAEWAQDAGGTWQQVRSVDTGLPSPRSIWFSPDGLRAIIVASATATTDVTAMLIDRATIDDPFNAPIAVPTLPAVDDLFMTADCTRVYMSGADSIFYALQI